MERTAIRRTHIGFEEAMTLAMAHVSALPPESRPVMDALGRVAAAEIRASVDSPSVDVSVKDGYAVLSSDVASADRDRPVELKIAGSVGAGHAPNVAVVSGSTVRILSGAAIPPGADAVLAEEFTEADTDVVRAFADAHPGRNILARGIDVSADEILVRPGEILTPSLIGLLVAGGVMEAPVFPLPKVGLLATGDEVLLPGRPLEEGKLYASNLALQEAWLRSRGIECITGISGDSSRELTESIGTMLNGVDALITSGGAWKGDRDLVVKVLDQLGWEFIFHRVRMGPGKAVGMGLLHGKPVFCLPGGPPSNEMAFLMIALPAILRLAGHMNPPFPERLGRLTTEVSGQIDWTQFIHCTVAVSNHECLLSPQNMKRRLSAMSRTQAIVKIPEGVERLDAHALIPFSPVSVDEV